MEKLWILSLESKKDQIKYFDCRNHTAERTTEYKIKNNTKVKQLDSDIRPYTYHSSCSILAINGTVETNRYIIPSKVRISFKMIRDDVASDETRNTFTTWVIDFKVDEDEKLLKPYRIINYSYDYKCNRPNGRYAYDQIISETKRYRKNDYYVRIVSYDKVFGKVIHRVNEYKGEDAKKRIESRVFESTLFTFKVEEYSQSCICI